MFGVVKQKPDLPISMREINFIQTDDILMMQFTQQLYATTRQTNNCTTAGNN